MLKPKSPAARMLLFGLKLTHIIPVSPLSVVSESPVFVFQSLIVLSQLPLANVVPSGLHATDETLRLR
jgi:hypothetical protein